MAERYLLVSVLTEALEVLSAILVELREFEAARDLAEAALPHVSTHCASMSESGVLIMLF